MWVSCVHHVCGSHTWAGGRCAHSEEDNDVPLKDGREYINPDSPAAAALREVVFDRRWMKSLDFYVRNRHTGLLEVITA